MCVFPGYSAVYSSSSSSSSSAAASSSSKENLKLRGGKETRCHLLTGNLIFHPDVWQLVPDILSIMLSDATIVYPGNGERAREGNLVIAVANEGR